MPNNTNDIATYAFTTKYNGKARCLKNDTIIRYDGSEIKVTALWDTGATSSCISTEVVAKLGMIATGKNLIKTPSGSKEVNTYLVDVGLPNNVNIPNLLVCDSDIGLQGLGMLIGMDIIGMGDFSVSNYNDCTVFSFRMPSKQTTDYVQQINCEKLIGPKHGPGKRKKK